MFKVVYKISTKMFFSGKMYQFPVLCNQGQLYSQIVITQAYQAYYLKICYTSFTDEMAPGFKLFITYPSSLNFQENCSLK